MCIWIINNYIMYLSNIEYAHFIIRFLFRQWKLWEAIIAMWACLFNFVSLFPGDGLVDFETWVMTRAACIRVAQNELNENSSEYCGILIEKLYMFAVLLFSWLTLKLNWGQTDIFHWSKDSKKRIHQFREATHRDWIELLCHVGTDGANLFSWQWVYIHDVARFSIHYDLSKLLQQKQK